MQVAKQLQCKLQWTCYSADLNSSVLLPNQPHAKIPSKLCCCPAVSLSVNSNQVAVHDWVVSAIYFSFSVPACKVDFYRSAFWGRNRNISLEKQTNRCTRPRVYYCYAANPLGSVVLVRPVRLLVFSTLPAIPLQDAASIHQATTTPAMFGRPLSAQNWGLSDT